MESQQTPQHNRAVRTLTEGNVTQAPLTKLAETNEDPHLMVDLNVKSTSFLVDTGACLSTLKPTKSTNLKTSKETVKAVGVGGIPMCLPVSEPTMVSIGPFTESMSSFTTCHSFLLSDTTPMNLLGQDLLCKLNCTIYCTPDGIFLETNQHNTTAVLAALINQNQPMSEEKVAVFWASSTLDTEGPT